MFIIIGSQGYFEDKQQWVVGFLNTKEQAEMYVKGATEAIAPMAELEKKWSICETLGKREEALRVCDEIYTLAKLNKYDNYFADGNGIENNVEYEWLEISYLGRVLQGKLTSVT